MSDKNSNTTNTNTNFDNNEASLPKIVKTLTFLAFLQGFEKNDFRAWTRSSTEDNPMIDTGLIPALTKHMAEYAKNLGDLLPKNPFKRGIQILDRKDAKILPGEQLLAVLVELNFVKLHKELTSENIAYAVKNMNPNFEPDRHLIALQISEEGLEAPCKECSYFEGQQQEDIWTVYVKKGERRPFFKDSGKKDASGNPIYEYTGYLEFPEKSAWEYLEERQKVVGNSKMIDYLRGLYKKEDIPQPKEPVETKKFVAKVKKDQLGSIGDNVKVSK
jgi:hypothetical protein